MGDVTVTITVPADIISRLYSPLDPESPMRAEHFGQLAVLIRDALSESAATGKDTERGQVMFKQGWCWYVWTGPLITQYRRWRWWWPGDWKYRWRQWRWERSYW